MSVEQGVAQPSAERQGRGTRKGPAAFRTIGEASEELGVPQHVLRFWETKFTQLKPLKRAGGRRYYRPEDMTLLTRIRDLLYQEGFTIKGARRHLRQKGGSEAEQESAAQEGAVDSEEAASADEAAPQEDAAESVPAEPPASPPAPLFEASEKAQEAERLRAALRSLHEELVALRRSLDGTASGPA